jgi:hypothetical protein
MRRRVGVLLLASLGALGALAPSASGAANADNASCVGLLASNAPAGAVGPTVTFWAHEFQPFGANVVSVGAPWKAPCPPPPPGPG